MITNNKYEDFIKKAKEANLLKGFSQYDLALAKENPDAGLSILSYKQDYMNAKTEEERARANAGAEQIRQSFGNYKGGSDGSKYYAIEKSYDRQGAGELANEIYNENQKTYSYNKEKPQYGNSYAEILKNKLKSLENREKFSYDPETDPLYSAYRKQYLREGKRAMADTMAEAAASTGGIASSYGVSAAQQAANYYNAALTDKIPALANNAYNRYSDDFTRDMAIYKAYAAAADSDFARYKTELDSYNKDREFDYNVYSDKSDRAKELLKIANYMNETENANELAKEKYDSSLKQQDSENRLSLVQFNQAVSENNFDEAYKLARLAAEYGDYSLLEKLGITASDGESEAELTDNSLAVNPDYVFVKNYGYMTYSQLGDLIACDQIQMQYNRKTGKHTYYYTGSSESSAKK